MLVTNAHAKMLLEALRHNSVVTSISLGSAAAVDVNLRLQLEFAALARDANGHEPVRILQSTGSD